MHILEIPSFLPPYGGLFCIDQSRALQLLGHTVRVLHCQQLGVTVYPWHYVTAPFCRYEESLEGGRGKRLLLFRTNMRGMPYCIRLNQRRYCHIITEMFDTYVSRYGMPDVIHAHCCQWAGTAADILNRRFGVPFVITEHLSTGMYRDIYGEGWRGHEWACELLADTYRHAACVVTVSARLMDDMAEMFSIECRHATVSNVIDTRFFRYKKREPLSRRPFRFCCLAVANGAFLHLKGYDTLVEAFGRVSNAELHIAGRATDTARMRRMVTEKAGLNGGNVVLHGDLQKPDVLRLLYHCDALVLASRSEAQPLVILEALSTGIPAVTTDAVPLDERYGNAVLSSPAGDAAAFAKNMDAVRRHRPSPLLHDIVCDIASPEKVAKQIENVLSDAVRRAGR